MKLRKIWVFQFTFISKFFLNMVQRSGKGEALWKSLYCTTGDIIIWVDTDIVNIHPRFVYGLIAPLLLQA